MLKVLAIVMGILVAATRLIGVIFPGAVKRLLKGMLEEKGVLLLLMVYGAVLGALFVWGFRLEYARQNTGWQAYILLVFGVLMVLMSLLSLATPKVLLGIMTKFAELEVTKLRLLCVVGVVVGVLLILLGWSIPHETGIILRTP
ncbi:MAG: hypothetical protein AMK75_04780 [Planctomycetes bacterium SM23_65]|nr:MAG: hypothetical protein AMK75_04780 [Planctomycetes bacterium SM23_65]